MAWTRGWDPMRSELSLIMQDQAADRASRMAQQSIEVLYDQRDRSTSDSRQDPLRLRLLGASNSLRNAC